MFKPKFYIGKPLSNLEKIAKNFYLNEVQQGRNHGSKLVGTFINGLPLYVGFSRYYGDVFDDDQVLFDCTGKFKLRDSNGFMVYAYTVKDE
ncbi:MAG: hypothetical protein K0S24_3193 [Sphingobacterium sp.]|jgi:hypothetical protein|nr:hypothetical protein [Sphingobacterium sp.]